MLPEPMWRLDPSGVRRRIAAAVLFAAVSLGGAAAGAAENASGPALQAILSGGIPTSAAELLVMQQHVQTLTQQLVATTVAVRVGQAHGSGVIISPQGFVLTAAHVAGEPNRRAVVILHDGQRLRGTTRGVFRTLDAGLIQIDPGAPGQSWPHADMGDSADVAPGQWCLATGHPGGFQNGRDPVVRLGRILAVKEDATIHSDCTLIGGDSGGPLFDMQGQVIGIHSRIGGPLNVNLHVPVSAYRDQWDRLAQGDAWGHVPGTQPYIGVQGEADSEIAKITQVFSGTPADKAGVRVGDVVTKFAGKPVSDFDSLKSYVEDEQPGTKVVIEVLRNERRVELQLEIGNRHG